MKASRFFIVTLKEAPADAEIVSHKLMMRAGMIRRVAGGIYNYLADRPALDPQGRGHRA